MKKLILQASMACFLSVLVVLSVLTLSAQAFVPGTDETGTGATVTAPNTGATDTGATALAPATDGTNTGTTPPGTGTTDTGDGSNPPGTGTTDTGDGSNPPGTGTTDTGDGGDTNPDITPPATDNQSNGGGGGSVISYLASPCADVTYGGWGVPANGFQYRDVIGQNPAGCALTATQQGARSRIVPQILGVKDYPDGSLLRTPDKKIYVIIDGQRQHIKNLKELYNYRGKKINDVSYEVLFQYPEVLGVKVYPDGSLLRGLDKKIYVIVNGKKQHIKNLKELYDNYRGKKINDVSYEVLAQYPDVK